MLDLDLEGGYNSILEECNHLEREASAYRASCIS